MRRVAKPARAFVEKQRREKDLGPIGLRVLVVAGGELFVLELVALYWLITGIDEDPVDDLDVISVMGEDAQGDLVIDQCFATGLKKEC